LSTFAFPELTTSDFETRYSFYSKTILKALCVFVESNSGKEELLNYTNLSADKIKVVPIFPKSRILNSKSNLPILSKYKLIKKQFFFYPAQFWTHKNHYSLVLAFNKFVKENKSYKLVLTGDDYGNKEFIIRLVKKLKLENKILFLGFVAEIEIEFLYTYATALVFPSFLGPTNMPPLEAREFECPILCSNLAGHRETLGNGAIYFEPNSESQILECMNKMTIEENRIKLIKTASLEKKKTKFTLKHALISIENHLKELATIRRIWDK